MYDVAKLAGVSHQTVSLVVRSGPNVRPQTRLRVEAAIATLGYRPNLTARALATAGQKRIGALFFDRYEQIGPTRNMQAAVDFARLSGYVVDVVGVEPDRPERVMPAIELILQAGVGGLVVFAPTATTVKLVEDLSLPVPLVIEATLTLDSFAGDRGRAFEGMRLAVEHLADLGHRRVMHISGPLSWITAVARRNEVRDVADLRGMDVVEMEGDWTARSGYAAGMEMPAAHGITAVLASNDQMALGALKALHERGIRVPADVSVLGFDDIPESEYFEPALTTISEDFEGRGRVAMDALLSLMQPGRARQHEWYREPRLVIRASTASPR